MVPVTKVAPSPKILIVGSRCLSLHSCFYCLKGGSEAAEESEAERERERERERFLKGGSEAAEESEAERCVRSK